MNKSILSIKIKNCCCSDEEIIEAVDFIPYCLNEKYSDLVDVRIEPTDDGKRRIILDIKPLDDVNGTLREIVGMVDELYGVTGVALNGNNFGGFCEVNGLYRVFDEPGRKAFGDNTVNLEKFIQKCLCVDDLFMVGYIEVIRVFFNDTTMEALENVVSKQKYKYHLMTLQNWLHKQQGTLRYELKDGDVENIFINGIRVPVKGIKQKAVKSYNGFDLGEFITTIKASVLLGQASSNVCDLIPKIREEVISRLGDEHLNRFTNDFNLTSYRGIHTFCKTIKEGIWVLYDYEIDDITESINTARLGNIIISDTESCFGRKVTELVSQGVSCEFIIDDVTAGYSAIFTFDEFSDDDINLVVGFNSEEEVIHAMILFLIMTND